MENPHPTSVAALLQGLLDDVWALIGQTVRLARDEIQLERQKVITMIMRASIGLAMALMTSLLLLLMVVHVLHGPLGLPLWASYGLVGLCCALMAGLLVSSAVSLGPTLRVWPRRTLHSIKEDVRWIKEQVLSIKI